MKLLNKDIYPAIKFLDSLKLKGRASLGRTKLKTKLSSKAEVFSKDQSDIIEEFEGWTDKDRGMFTQGNKEMNEALNEYYKEEIEIAYDSPFRKDFAKALENYEGELSESDADIYALLYDELIEEKESDK